MIRVGVAASICFYRDGLTLALDADSRLTVVATARTGAEAVARFTPGVADVAVLDLGVESLHTVRALRRRSRETQIVVLGIADSHDEVIRWAEAGAAGYASRSTSLAELILVVLAAARGELRCPPEVAGALMRRVGVLASAGTANAVLTSREAEVADLIGVGLSNKEIATRRSVRSSDNNPSARARHSPSVHIASNVSKTPAQLSFPERHPARSRPLSKRVSGTFGLFRSGGLV